VNDATNIPTVNHNTVTLSTEQFKNIQNQTMSICGVALEHLDWLSGIMKSICKLGDKEFSTIKSLTHAGVHLSDDGANLINCIKGDLEKLLVEVAAKPPIE
jgi:hypothetical protein